MTISERSQMRLDRAIEAKPYRRMQCDACRGSGKRKGTRRTGILRTNSDQDMRKNRPCMDCMGLGYIDRRVR